MVLKKLTKFSEKKESNSHETSLDVNVPKNKNRRLEKINVEYKEKPLEKYVPKNYSLKKLKPLKKIDSEKKPSESFRKKEPETKPKTEKSFKKTLKKKEPKPSESFRKKDPETKPKTEKSFKKTLKKKEPKLSESLRKKEPKTQTLKPTTEENKSPKLNTIDDMLDELSERTDQISKDTEPAIETFSFLEDEPTVKRIKLKNYKIQNLYSKIDSFSKDDKKQENKNKKLDNKTKKLDNKKTLGIIEEIDVPDIISLKDDTNLINYEDEDFLSQEQKSEEKEEPIPVMVDTGKGVDVNPYVKENIKKIDEKPRNIEQKTIVVEQPKEQPKIKDVKEKEPKEDTFEYVRPIDDNTKNKTETPRTMRTTTFISDRNKEQQDIGHLVYTIDVAKRKKDLTNVYDKYSINDFTFVTISYKENRLFYNIVQPKLTPEQDKIYQEIKEIFLDSIDQNFFSFKGDSQEIKNYISKIYDLSIDKISSPISSLDKKLYLLFIENDFTGLGFLANVLRDENIIEVNCMGAGTPINVYHIKYGMIETNLFFEDVPKLNVFVLGLTKTMGLYINSNHPVIDGYLPNGYKVEGLYSVGDISSKGSSFVIKKFLDKPLCPISLVNLGIGTIDIYSYIWSAIAKDYHIIITGNCDKSIMLNGISLLYPDKEIITIQTHDNLKLPQKKWIRRKSDRTSEIELKTILDQSIAEKPDYIIVDNFIEEFFESTWYNINLLTADLKIFSSIIEKMKLIGQKTIVINLKRINLGKQEQIQIEEINEYVKGKEYNILKLNEDNLGFRINLLSSNIDIVDYKNKKEVLYWMQKTDIDDYRDFNNIVDDYQKDPKKLLKKLNIDQNE